MKGHPRLVGLDSLSCRVLTQRHRGRSKDDRLGRTVDLNLSGLMILFDNLAVAKLLRPGQCEPYQIPVCLLTCLYSFCEADGEVLELFH